MAISFDDRPITIGSILLLTGTWENGDTSIDASDYLSEILFFDILVNSATEQANPTGFVDTTCHFTESGSDGGRFIILGRR
jgi:hypothetical protein